MRRLFYVADDLETTRAVSDAVHEEGIRDHDFHVVSRDEAGLFRHRIHSAMTYHQLDVIHTGERWALAGVGVGLAAVLLLKLATPWDFSPDAIASAALVAFGGLFGAWQGGMVGLTRENYKLAPYHHELEAGRHVIMIDVPREREHDVRDLLRVRFPQVQAAGADTTLINPFETPPRIYRQNTH